MATRAVFLDLRGVLIDSMQAHAKPGADARRARHQNGRTSDLPAWKEQKAETPSALLMEKHGLQRTPENSGMVERSGRSTGRRHRNDCGRTHGCWWMKLVSGNVQLTIVTGF